MKANIKITYLIAVLLTIGIFAACQKESVPIAIDTTTPQIVSLTTNKADIQFGGSDPAILTCDATGGNLSFKWEVDLGDLFAIKEDNSVVRFTGSPCCVGKKYIKCTVSNDKGSDTKTIIINILEP